MTKKSIKKINVMFQDSEICSLFEKKWTAVIDKFINDKEFIAEFRKSKDSQLLVFDLELNYYFFDLCSNYHDGMVSSNLPLQQLVHRNPMFLGCCLCGDFEDRATIEKLEDSICFNDIVQSFCGNISSIFYLFSLLEELENE
jgi:hypothetical protein